MQEQHAVGNPGSTSHRPCAHDQPSGRLDADPPTAPLRRQLDQHTAITRPQVNHEIRPLDPNPFDQKIDDNSWIGAPRRETDSRHFERIKTFLTAQAPARNDEARPVLAGRNSHQRIHDTRLRTGRSVDTPARRPARCAPRYPGIHHPTHPPPSPSLLINQGLRHHGLGRHVAWTLRPTGRNRTLALRATPPRQRQVSREMSARPVPLRPQVDDIVDQRRQSPAHRLAKNERLRKSEIRAHAIQRDRERTRHAELQAHIVRLPSGEEIRKWQLPDHLYVANIRCTTNLGLHKTLRGQVQSIPARAGSQRDKQVNPRVNPRPKTHRGTDKKFNQDPPQPIQTHPRHSPTQPEKAAQAPTQPPPRIAPTRRQRPPPGPSPLREPARPRGPDPAQPIPDSTSSTARPATESAPLPDPNPNQQPPAHHPKTRPGASRTTQQSICEHAAKPSEPVHSSRVQTASKERCTARRASTE